MSDLSSLSREERKSNFGAVRCVEDPHRTSTTKVGNRHTCGSPELWGYSGSYELSAIARFRFRLNAHMPSVVATGGIAGGSHEYQANPGSTSRLSQSHRSN